MKQFANGKPSIMSKIIEIFHRSPSRTNRDHILSACINSVLCVVVATEAFGLGVDVYDIRSLTFSMLVQKNYAYAKSRNKVGLIWLSRCDVIKTLHSV